MRLFSRDHSYISVVFFFSELFSYYLYLMDLTVEFLLYCLRMSLYSPRLEFLRCDKVQWVKLDGSG